MSQRDSGYARKERDLYETPAWVTHALKPHVPVWVERIWECAAGNGKMSNALRAGGFTVFDSDISTGHDFLSNGLNVPGPWDAIITNPPYELATEFIVRSLGLIRDYNGFVAMLLRTDFDHASSRRCLFSDNEVFAKKLVLTKRIKWFEDSKGQPSFNHAWFIWDWRHRGAPTLAYGP